MILPDWRIENLAIKGAITPFDPTRLQPASYDMALDKYFRFYENHTISPRAARAFDMWIDPKSPERRTRQVEATEYFEIGPHAFVLASSVERFKFPHDVQGRCDGKSSLGRMGLMVHVTAGNFDPGFEGTATLELFNANSLPIRLYPGMTIAQMVFQKMDGDSKRSYAGKYQNQGAIEPGPRESEYYKNFLGNQTSDPWPGPA